MGKREGQVLGAGRSATAPIRLLTSATPIRLILGFNRDPPPYLGGYGAMSMDDFGLLSCFSGGYHWAMPFEPKGNLPRLERYHYQHHAVVFWTNTVEERARGWLTPAFHAAFREILLHSAARYAVWCPVYCLMPDHLHLVWMGLRHESDQLNAMKILRAELGPALGQGREWQHQAHDHVLREEERKRNAFAMTCFYVLENPARDHLVDSAREWPFSGAMVPGYPRLHPLAEGYWDLFWKLYTTAREAEPPPSGPPPLRKSPQ